MRLRLALLYAILLIAPSAATEVRPVVPIPDPIGVGVPAEIELPLTALALLEPSIAAWHEASESGRIPESRLLENDINRQIADDIDAHQTRLREMARELLKLVDTTAPPTELDAEAAAQRALFETTLSILSQKRLIAENLRRTRSLENRSRLLGDYVDLLRRELRMSRPKLAAASMAED